MQMAILINNQDMIWDVWQREMISTTGDSVVFLATLGGLGFTGVESIPQVLGVARTVCTQPATITAAELSTGTLVRNSIQGAGNTGGTQGYYQDANERCIDQMDNLHQILKWVFLNPPQMLQVEYMEIHWLIQKLIMEMH